MRFMVLVKAGQDSEAGVLPSKELVAEMGKYNEELVKAGVLLAAEGLHASSKGARVVFSGDKRTVTEASDFPPEILPPEDATREQALRDQLPGS